MQSPTRSFDGQADAAHWAVRSTIGPWDIQCVSTPPAGPDLANTPFPAPRPLRLDLNLSANVRVRSNVPPCVAGYHFYIACTSRWQRRRTTRPLLFNDLHTSSLLDKPPSSLILATSQPVSLSHRSCFSPAAPTLGPLPVPLPASPRPPQYSYPH